MPRSLTSQGIAYALPPAGGCAPCFLDHFQTTPKQLPTVQVRVGTQVVAQRLHARICATRAEILGADSAIEELGRADAVAGYVTISSLNRALERERAAVGGRPGYED